VAVLEKDVGLQQSLPPQKPFSHAYIATEPLRGPQAIRRVTENPFKTEFREAMKLMNMRKADIDEVIEDVNEDLEHSFIDFLKATMRTAVAGDPDIDPRRHSKLLKFLQLP
jgi:hypothetical protein